MSTSAVLVRALGVATLAGLCFVPASARAHFVLSSPAAAHEQGGLGDPQKAPPCGDNGTAVATGIVTPYQAGDTVTIEIDETITHPGHYRIALAINDPSELPEEPMYYAGGGYECGTADIMDPAVFPVLADGVFAHTSGFGGPQSIDIVLPDDVSCTNCTLQVIQFMSDHNLNPEGGCFYHHCAQISIQGGASEGTTTMPGEDSGSGGDSSTGATSVTTAATNNDSGDDTSDDAADASATAASTAATTTAGTGDTDTAGSDDDEDSGCSCSTDGRSPLAAMLGMVALLGLRTRRRG